MIRCKISKIKLPNQIEIYDNLIFDNSLLGMIFGVFDIFLISNYLFNEKVIYQQVHNSIVQVQRKN